MLIDTYAKFIEEWGKQSRRAPYEKACMQVHKRLQVINEEMSNQRGWSCIKEITCRVKTPDSCLNKMLDKGYAADVELAAEKLNDIAGVRAVCYFLDDMYQVMEMLRTTPGYEFIKVKDYVEKPKASGYQSLHLIMKVPAGEQMVKVETQIRTQAMDFWSDIEHHFVYKTNNLNIEECEEEFLKCSKSIRKIDKQMLKIRRKIENTQ
ncbi:MAG: GTP pyrophosphokinase family protein [Lachnospiraceae bacterium]